MPFFLCTYITNKQIPYGSGNVFGNEHNLRTSLQEGLDIKSKLPKFVTYSSLNTKSLLLISWNKNNQHRIFYGIFQIVLTLNEANALNNIYDPKNKTCVSIEVRHDDIK